MRIFIFFLFFYFGRFYDIFIKPFSSPFCLEQISNPCTGSISSPFDDLQYTFAFVNTQTAILSQNLTFNLICQDNAYNFFPLRSWSSGYGASRSPFENFQGEIRFISIKIIDESNGLYAPSENFAIIILKTDDIYLKINSYLIIQNIIISGIDMQMEYICDQMPNPLTCTCGPDPTQTLYNSNSICYIEKSEIPHSDIVYDGFIQLVGLSSKLRIINVSVMNFNSFSKQITFISLMALYSQVEIVNMSISQAYLAKSFISSGLKDIYIDISINNIQIIKFNYFTIFKQTVDWRSLSTQIYDFQSAKGTLKIINSAYDIDFSEKINVLKLDKSSFFVIFDTFLLEMGRSYQGNQYFNAFLIQNSENQSNKIKLSRFSIEKIHALFYVDSNSDIEIIGGLAQCQNELMGLNINMTASYMVFIYLYRTFYLSSWSLSCNIYINHSQSLGSQYGFFTSDSPENFVKVYNLTVILSQTVFVFNKADVNEKLSYLEIIESNFSYVIGNINGFFRGFSNIFAMIKNTNMENIYAPSGVSGIFLILGFYNTIQIDNLTVYNSLSYGMGSIISGILNSDNKLIINNSRFSAVNSFTMGNIFIENFTLIIENSEFNNFSSPTSSFIYGKQSNISINNISFYYGVTTYEGFITLFSSNLEIKNSYFQVLQGSSSILIYGILSKVNLDNIEVRNCSFDDSLISFSSSYFIANDSRFLDFSNGVVIKAEESNPLVSINNCYFKNIQVQSYGCFYFNKNNQITLDLSTFINIYSPSHGTLINLNKNNTISISGISTYDCSSLGKGLFFIFDSNFLLDKSNFSSIQTELQGGIIASSGGFFQIVECMLFNVTARSGCLISSIGSVNVIIGCTIINSLGTQGGSVIDLTTSNLTIANSTIKTNFTRIPEITYVSIILIKNNFQQNSIVKFANLQISLSSSDISMGVIFSLSGITDLFIGDLIFSDNYCDKMIVLTNCLCSINNSYIVGNYFLGFIEAIYDNSEKISTLNIFNATIIDNNLRGNIFSIHGNENYKFFMKHISISSNIKSSLSDNLIILNNIAGVFENINITNNLGKTTKEMDSYFLDINQAKFLFNNINFSNNSLQLLKCQTSQINFTNIAILNSTFWILNYIYNSSIFYSLSIISGNSGLATSNAISNKISVFFSGDSSNMFFISVNFENAQSEVLFSLGLAQYTFYIQNFKILKLDSTNCTNNIDYSLYLALGDGVAINNCLFQKQFDQEKEYYNPGIIYLSDISNITLNNSIFKNIGANQSFSALTIENTEKNSYILLENTNFTENKAARGGAISTLGTTVTSIFNCSFLKNKANYFPFSSHAFSGYGGSLFSSCTIEDECKLDIFSSKFENNTVNFFGSAIYMDKFHATLKNDNIISDNSAINHPNLDVAYMSSPHFINISSLQVSNENEIFFSKDNQTNLITVNNKQEIELSFILYDADSNKYDYDFLSFASLIVTNDTLLKIKNSNSFVKNGYLNFTSIIFEGEINTNYSVQLQISGDYNLTKTLIIIVRNCSSGEYYDNIINTCVECPENSYSFVPPGILGQESCNACPNNAYCKGNKIVPDENFWIGPSNFTSKIIQCPMKGSCIYEPFENFKKPIQCYEGHQGALCVVCQENYSKNNFESDCFKCSFESKDIFLYLFKVLFGMALIIYQINSVFSSTKTERNSLSILLKLLRDHFVQAILIMPFSIFSLDYSTISFFQASNEIITYSGLNFDCLYDSNFLTDIFFFKIFMIIINPLIMLVLIGLAYLVFFCYKKIIGRVVYRSSYFKILLISFIVICDSQYPHFMTGFLKLFECITLDSDDSTSYLKFAPHIVCYTSTHQILALSLGIPCLLLWILGLPLTFFIVLYFKKKSSESKRMRISASIFDAGTTKNISMKTIAEKEKPKKNIKLFENNLGSYEILKFLFLDYKANRYYWSSIVMIWKSALSILVAMAPSFSIHLYLFLFYSIVILLYSIGKPHKSDNFLFLTQMSFIVNELSVCLREIMQNNYNLQIFTEILNLIIQLFFFLLVFYIFFFREYNWKQIAAQLEPLLRKRQNYRLVKIILEKIEKFLKSNEPSPIKIQIPEIKQIQKEGTENLSSEQDCLQETGKKNIKESITSDYEISPKDDEYSSANKKKISTIIIRDFHSFPKKLKLDSE